MPAEPVSVLLRPRNFFKRNPALDVRPSFSSWPSKVAGAHGNGNGNGVNGAAAFGVGGNGCHSANGGDVRV